MSEITKVQKVGTIEPLIAVHQYNMQSPTRFAKITMNVDNISYCVEEDVQYFKYNDKDVNAATIAYCSDLIGDTIDQKAIVDLFSDLHKILSKVTKRYYYMNNGSIITTVMSPAIEAPIVDDEGFYILNPAKPEWWLKNVALNTIIEEIRKEIPDFSPWKGLGDTFIQYLEKVSKPKRSALLPNK